MRFMKTRTLTLVCALAAVLAFGCEKKEGGDAGSGGAVTGKEPTKELLIKTVETLHAKLEAKDWDGALKHLVLPPGADPKDAPKQLGKMIERKEVSKAGIAVLAAKGKYGKLTDINPERAERRAKRAGVPVDQTYGIGYEEAEVMAHWTGSEFKIFRLDDVGKIEGK